MKPTLTEILNRAKTNSPTINLMKFDLVKHYNQQIGTTTDCKLCNGKGNIMHGDNNDHYLTLCDCEIKRMFEYKLKQSGYLKPSRNCTFENFRTDEPFQEKAKNRVLTNTLSENWLLLGGQVGSGKTHLAISLLLENLKHGKSVDVMDWRTQSTELKFTMIENFSDYSLKMRNLKTVDCLLIDDFFKGKPTEADLKLAYEIIDYRYRNQLKTVFTTEKNAQELLQIDEAIGSRILHNCDIVIMKNEHGRNYRLKRKEQTT